MFPDSSIDPAATSPMRPGEFIENILAPEVAVALIRHDLNIDVPEAIQTMKDSAHYGTAMFPDLNVGDTVGDKMMKERARARRRELNREEEAEVLAGSQRSERFNANAEADSDGTNSTAPIAKSSRRTREPRKAKTQAMKNLRDDIASAMSTDSEDERQTNRSIAKGKALKGKGRALEPQEQTKKAPATNRLNMESSLNLALSSSDEDLRTRAIDNIKFRRDEASRPVATANKKQAVSKPPLNTKMNPLEMARTRKPANR